MRSQYSLCATGLGSSPNRPASIPVPGADSMTVAPNSDQRKIVRGVRAMRETAEHVPDHRNRIICRGGGVHVATDMFRGFPRRTDHSRPLIVRPRRRSADHGRSVNVSDDRVALMRAVVGCTQSVLESIQRSRAAVGVPVEPCLWNRLRRIISTPGHHRSRPESSGLSNAFCPESNRRPLAVLRSPPKPPGFESTCEKQRSSASTASEPRKFV